MPPKKYIPNLFYNRKKEKDKGEAFAHTTEGRYYDIYN
jgi:hypothetical protein